MKHTAISLMLQAGVKPFDVSGYTQTSLETIQRVYGHHPADFLSAAAESDRRPLGRVAQALNGDVVGWTIFSGP